jgi:hydrogenase maturation factor
MTKRFTTLVAFIAAIGILGPAAAFARTVTGHVTGFSPTSISVFDREIVIIGFDNSTAFTKLVTQKAWQQDMALTANALRVGNYVVVHVPNGTAVADWVQVATDFRYEAFAVTAQTPAAPVNTSIEAARHRAEARARRMSPTASETKRPGSPDTALHCDRIADRLEKAGK